MENKNVLGDANNRYSFLDRHGHPLNLSRTTAYDQNGKEYGPDFRGLTSIVIISAERGNETKKCVEAIFNNTLTPLEIIISDVGSGPETRAIISELEDKHKNIHVIYNKQSTGTTGQRNQGIFYSKGEFIALMDNDVLVLPEWLMHLKAVAANDSNVGLIGAKLLKAESKKVYYCGGHAVTLEKNGTIYGIGLDKAGSMADLNRYDPLAMKGGEVPWYTTTLLLARRETLFDVGGFDDMIDEKGIFIANEDKDLSLSIRRGGYKIYYCPESEGIHNHDYAKVNREDDYHSKYRLRMEQIEKDTRYFLNKWDIMYMIEKLHHEDNTCKWDGQTSTRFAIDLDSDEFKNDIVTIDTLAS